jgi:hypothetical protein
MGAYNRKQVDPGMSWNTVAQQLEGIYQTVLSQRKSRVLRHHNASPAFWRSAGSTPNQEIGS